MEIEGVVIKALDVRSGTTERGNWMSQDYVLETTHRDNWKTRMVFTVFGSDAIKRFGIKEGQKVNVSFNIDAREHNGRWFNSVRAFDVHLRIDETMAAPSPTGTGTQEASAAVDPLNPFGGAPTNELPFG